MVKFYTLELSAKRLRRFDLPSPAMIRMGQIRLRWWWSRNDLTIDGWQLVALVAVQGRGSLLDMGGLLHLALHPVLFSQIIHGDTVTGGVTWSPTPVGLSSLHVP